MVLDYDVIIAGAGPAGAECARYLSDHSKYKVLLLDRTQEIGEPKKSTAGTFSEAMKVFRLPKKIVQCKINKAIIESPSEQVVFPVKGYVLDFAKLKKFLVEDAVHHGVDVKIQANVTKPVIEKNRVVGVEYSDGDGVHVARAKIIIDATGPPAVLSTRLGLRKIDQKNHWVGAEFEMEHLKLKQQNAFLIHLDHTYAPGGYSWIFSTGKNHAKVGNCWQTAYFRNKCGSGSQLNYLKKWIKSDERLRNGIAIEVHGGDAYFDSVGHLSADNFMAIGDAVCAINPLSAEGIRPGMYSGMFAAQAAIAALKKGDVSGRQLAAYDAKWNAYNAQRRLSGLMNKVVYRLPNSGFDMVVRNVRKLGAGPFINRFVNLKFSLYDMRKLFK